MTAIYATANPGLFGARSFPVSSLLALLGCLAVGPADLLIANRKGEVWAGIAAALFVLAAAGALILPTLTSMSILNTAREAYAGQVAGWLADDYGIHLTIPETARLLNGGGLVVTVDSIPVNISIVPAAGGDLAVVDERESPLVPIV